MELGYDLEQEKEAPDMQDLVQLQQYYCEKMSPTTIKNKSNKIHKKLQLMFTSITRIDSMNLLLTTCTL